MSVNKDVGKLKTRWDVETFEVNCKGDMLHVKKNFNLLYVNSVCMFWMVYKRN